MTNYVKEEALAYVVPDEESEGAAARKPKGLYTFDDYLSWNTQMLIELLDGVPYHRNGGRLSEAEMLALEDSVGNPNADAMEMMSPGAATAHQRISGELFFLLKTFLRGKPCEVFSPPFDVKLSAKKHDVVEPDLFVVCDASKIDEHRCNGAPDLVVEVLSPSSVRRDKIIKYRKYLQTGVREYWIVDPREATVMACVLDGERYTANIYGEGDLVPVTVLQGCVIDLGEVFGGQQFADQQKEQKQAK
jgi:Uma2 family endonuclease